MRTKSKSKTKTILKSISNDLILFKGLSISNLLNNSNHHQDESINSNSDNSFSISQESRSISQKRVKKSSRHTKFHIGNEYNERHTKKFLEDKDRCLRAIFLDDQIKTDSQSNDEPKEEKKSNITKNDTKNKKNAKNNEKESINISDSTVNNIFNKNNYYTSNNNNSSSNNNNRSSKNNGKKENLNLLRVLPQNLYCGNSPKQMSGAGTPCFGSVACHFQKNKSDNVNNKKKKSEKKVKKVEKKK